MRISLNKGGLEGCRPGLLPWREPLRAPLQFPFYQEAPWLQRRFKQLTRGEEEVFSAGLYFILDAKIPYFRVVLMIWLYAS